MFPISEDLKSKILLSKIGMSRPVASADIFQAIADPTRRALLDRLSTGEQPVKQLAEAVCNELASHIPALADSL